MKRRVKNTCIAIVCFIILFFVIINLFHLPIRGENNLSTEETESTSNVIGDISNEQVVTQSLFFHKPVRLHSMDVLATNHANTATMPEITYYIMDSAKRTVYKSSIPTSNIVDNTYLHIELGDIKLNANQRYFLCFQGATENDTIVCPTFYMMPKNDVSDYLYYKDSLVPNMALCARYYYDVVPMGTTSILFFVILLSLMVAIANLKTGFLRQNIWMIPTGIWLVFWGGMFLSVIFISSPPNEWIPCDKALIFALILLFLIAGGVILNRNLRIRKMTKLIGEFVYKYRLFFGLLYFAAIFTIQYILAANLYQKIGWDVRAIWDITSNWLAAENPHPYGYLTTYPNNTGIALLIYYLRFLVKGLDIAKQYHFLVMINVALLDFGIFMTYRAAKRMWGFSVGVMSMIGVSLLIGFSGWIVVPYTDTMSLWIPITIFYLFMLADDKSRSNKIQYSSMLGIGFLAALGYFLKPQCVIIVIAIAITMLFRLLRMKKWKSEWAKYGLVIWVSAAGAIAGFLFLSICEINVLSGHTTRDNAVSMSHFFMMGLNENPDAIQVGSYSGEDVKLTSSKKGKKEKSQENWEVAKERLEDFGVAGYMNHLYQKGIWILGDGTFFWLNEGSFFVEDYSQNGSEFQRKLRERYYDKRFLSDSDNVKYTEFMGMFQGFWLIILGLFTIMPLLTGKNLGEKEAVLCLSALGCVMFTLLFEGRSRYLILYIPIYTMLAAAGLHRLIILISNCIQNRVGKNKSVNTNLL